MTYKFKDLDSANFEKLFKIIGEDNVRKELEGTLLSVKGYRPQKAPMNLVAENAVKAVKQGLPKSIAKLTKMLDSFFYFYNMTEKIEKFLALDEITLSDKVSLFREELLAGCDMPYRLLFTILGIEIIESNDYFMRMVYEQHMFYSGKMTDLIASNKKLEADILELSKKLDAEKKKTSKSKQKNDDELAKKESYEQIISKLNSEKDRMADENASLNKKIVEKDKEIQKLINQNKKYEKINEDATKLRKSLSQSENKIKELEKILSEKEKNSFNVDDLKEVVEVVCSEMNQSGALTDLLTEELRNLFDENESIFDVLHDISSIITSNRLKLNDILNESKIDYSRALKACTDMKKYAMYEFILSKALDSLIYSQASKDNTMSKDIIM